MPARAQPVSLRYRVLIFFASSPEMSLTAAEIIRKFGLNPESNVQNLLNNVLNQNLVKKVLISGANHYSAGPALLSELGYE
jgi:DNA-binding IclR family transcriptional regulator